MLLLLLLLLLYTITKSYQYEKKFAEVGGMLELVLKHLLSKKAKLSYVALQINTYCHYVKFNVKLLQLFLMQFD